MIPYPTSTASRIGLRHGNMDDGGRARQVTAHQAMPLIWQRRVTVVADSRASNVMSSTRRAPANGTNAVSSAAALQSAEALSGVGRSKLAGFFVPRHRLLGVGLKANDRCCRQFVGVERGAKAECAQT